MPNELMISEFLLNSPSFFYLGLFFLGLLASFLGSSIGLGGGFLIVPLAHMIFGFAFKDAVFLSLGAVMIVSLYHNHKNRPLIKAHRAQLLPLALFTVAGGVLSSIIQNQMQSDTLEILFACALIAFALYFFFDRQIALEVSDPAHAGPKIKASVFGMGFLAGLFGIGGGTLAVPTLYKLMRFSLQEAAKLSFFFTFLAAIAAIVTQLQLRRNELEQIPMGALLLLTLGVLSGASLSRRFLKLNPTAIRRLFSVVLLLIGVSKLYS